MIYNVFAILLSFLIPILLLFADVKKEKNLKKFIRNNYKIIIMYCVFVIGFLVRSVSIDKYPKGLNCDEASSGYEAFSILNYGIDRNENSFPVFLEAWGSGQNALYTYIMIPFVKLMGLNIISTRLPMVLISCVSLIVWFKLLKEIKGENFAIIGLCFLAICPWHIMKSRWGLESNVFPDLTLYAIFYIVKYIKENKCNYLYIASMVLGITGYSYGTSYFFLPIFCFLLYIYLLCTKKAKITSILISLLIIFIICLPIMLYVVINTFDLNQINLGFMTIPKLPVNRYEQQTSLFDGNILYNFIINFKNSFEILIKQNDGCTWNCINGFGIYYIFSLPLLIIGLIEVIKNNEKNQWIINVWFIAAFLLLFVFKEININRINILFFPLIYYISDGLYLVIKEKNIYLNIGIIFIYTIFFVLFEIKYFNDDNKNFVFVDDIKEMIEYVDLIETDNIYIDYSFKEPYIYILYYTKCDVHTFINTVQYFDSNNLGRFDNVKAFGKYKFYLPNKKLEQNEICVLKKNDNINYELYKNYKIKEFKEYVVIMGEN